MINPPSIQSSQEAAPAQGGGAPPSSPSARRKFIERIRAKHADYDGADDDDEALFARADKDYEEYDSRIGELEGYERDSRSLADMFAVDPRSADMLADMHAGKSPVIGLIRNFGPEIRDVLDDPDMQDAIAEAEQDYLKRVARDKELKAQWDENMKRSVAELDAFAAERGLSPEQADEVFQALMQILNDGILGKFSRASFEMIDKARTRDDDVRAASEEGLAAGRNAKIAEKLRSMRDTDGTAPLPGQAASTPVSRKSQTSIFDLAAEA